MMLLLVALLWLGAPPAEKHAFRGAWIATVVNLDWPSKPTLTPEQQRAELVVLLDSLRGMGLNAVLFQIRGEADAFYASKYEPWSYWLTGEQGRAPVPFWDPLTFAVEEAHKRGMELHAWMNPYRAHREVGKGYAWADSHPAKRHPEWVMKFTSGQTTYAMFDPGMPEVRDHIANVVADVLRRYDVDGIHFDDYFYPYNPKITTEDAASYRRHGQGRDIHDWRRASIDAMVAQVADTIRVLAPHVKFGLSPFGIRLNSDAGTRGTEAYHALYADAESWLKNGWVDYITPQLYWPRAFEIAPYGALASWWGRTAARYGRHLYVGMAPYRLSDTRNWSAAELGAQIRLNRSPEVGGQGEIYFRARNLTANQGRFADSLRTRHYARPALTPPMPWKAGLAPDPVEDLRTERPQATHVRLEWTPAAGAARYAIYRFEADRLPNDPTLPPDGQHLVGVTGEPRFDDTRGLVAGRSYIYLVTAVGRTGLESAARGSFRD